MKLCLSLLFIAFLSFIGTANAASVDFEQDVLPILSRSCLRCHVGEDPEGGLRFDSKEHLLAGGDEVKSEILERVLSDDPDLVMPAQGARLTKKQIDILRQWIAQDLPWDTSIDLAAIRVGSLKPRRPQFWPAHGTSHVNPIDVILQPYLKANKIELLPSVSDAAFARRVTLDLTGVLPTPEELAQFEQDNGWNKRLLLPHTLLNNDEAYAEHWFTFWNDLLRNDYVGTGYIDGGRKQISKWLYRSLLENKPYDQFVQELIAPSKESAGFIHGIQWRGRVNSSQTVEVQFAQNVGQVFLGINLKCASCHDSFVDNWKLADTYALAAVISEKPLELYRCNKPTGKMAKMGFLFPELGTIDASLPKKERLAQLAQLLTQEENGRFARTIVNRLWQRLMGRGIVHPVDVMDNEPFDADLLDYLANYLVDNNYDLKKTIELIATSSVYQSQCYQPKETEPEGEYVFRGPVAKLFTAEQFVDATDQLLDSAHKKAAFGTKQRSTKRFRAVFRTSDPLMRSLGRPNRELVITTRPETLTTLVALELTNGTTLTKRIAHGAKTALESHPDWTTEDAATWLYQSALSRQPSSEEMKIAEQIVGEQLTVSGFGDLIWSVLMLPEFQFVQ